MTLCLYSSSHVASVSTRRPRSNDWKKYWFVVSRELGVFVLFLFFLLLLTCHFNRRTQSFMEENLSDLITLIIWPHNSPNYNSLGYNVWDTVERMTKKNPWWTEGKDNGCIYQFKQENNRKGLQEIPKLSRGRDWSYW